jgi:hypothetical protein
MTAGARAVCAGRRGAGVTWRQERACSPSAAPTFVRHIVQYRVCQSDHTSEAASETSFHPNQIVSIFACQTARQPPTHVSGGLRFGATATAAAVHCRCRPSNIGSRRAPPSCGSWAASKSNNPLHVTSHTLCVPHAAPLQPSPHPCNPVLERLLEAVR